MKAHCSEFPNVFYGVFFFYSVWLLKDIILKYIVKEDKLVQTFQNLHLYAMGPPLKKRSTSSSVLHAQCADRN